MLLLEEGEHRIGRSSRCEVRLDGPGVSRFHARLLVTATSIEVVDLSSKNGTFVNNEPIVEIARLRARDTLRVGAHRMTIVAVAGTGMQGAPLPEMPLPVIANETTAPDITATAARVLDLVEILAEDLLRRFAEPNTVATIVTAIDDLLDGAGLGHPPLGDRDAHRLRDLVKLVAARTNDPEIKRWEASVCSRLAGPSPVMYAAC